MKNLHRLRRYIIATTLIASGLLALAPQAQAAHWEISYRPEGKVTSTGSYYNTPDQTWLNTDHPYYDPNTGWIDYKNEYSSVYFNSIRDSEPRASGNTSVATSVTTKGTIAIRLKWVQDTWDVIAAPAPEYVFLKVWGNVGALAWAPEGQTKVRFGKLETQNQGTNVNSNFFVFQNDPIIIPLKVDGTTSEATYVFPLSAEASTQAFSPAAGVPGSIAEVTFYSEFRQVGVAISSDIELSWRKWVGAVEDLPNAYKARNSSGQFINEPNEKAVQVLGQDTTNDSSDDVWKLVCLRNADGTMDVHSAARISFGSGLDAQGQPSMTYFWYGGGAFTANTQGMTSPTLSWDVAANTNVYAGNPLVLVDYPHSNPFGPSTLTLGTGKTLPIRSTNIKVTATQSPITLTDSYTVNWHEPLENFASSGASITTYGILPATVTNDSPAVVGPEGEIEVWVNPQTLKAMVLLSTGEGVAVAAGSAIVGAAVGSVGLPATWAASWGTGMTIKNAAAAFALLRTGPAVVFNENLAQQEILTIKNTSQEWAKAIDSTRRSLQADTSADVRVMPTDIAWREPNDLEYLSAEMRAAVKTTTTWKPWTADEYGKNGFNGRVPGHDEEEKVEVVGVYTYTGIPPVF